MPKYDVIFFADENEDSQARNFVKSLDRKMRAKVYRLISMISENGPELREPYSKHLNDGIFELRAKVGSDISRVLYFFFIGHHVIVTNGFIKKTQKTPQVEIDKAKAFRKEYIEREGKKDDKV